MTGEPRCLGSCVLIHTRKSRTVPSTARDRLDIIRSDPAGHHGWGGRWMRCGRRPGFRWDSPISGPTGAGPVSGGVHSTGAAVSPPTRCGSSTSAGMPSVASRMGVEALPGAFPGKGDRDCRKPGEIADLTLSSGRGPGRVSPQMRRIKLALTPL